MYIGAMTEAVSFKYLAGIWSGPPDLEGLMFFNNFSTPSVPKEMCGMSGKACCNFGNVVRSSSVNTDENWLTKALALLGSVAAGIPLLDLRVGMPELSFLRDLMYDQNGFGFSAIFSSIIPFM